jgi:hypothetical protein
MKAHRSWIFLGFLVSLLLAFGTAYYFDDSIHLIFACIATSFLTTFILVKEKDD